MKYYYLSANFFSKPSVNDINELEGKPKWLNPYPEDQLIGGSGECFFYSKDKSKVEEWAQEYEPVWKEWKTWHLDSPK